MLRLSLLLFALLAAGCYDDAGVPAPKNDPLPEANLSLSDLSARCGDCLLYTSTGAEFRGAGKLSLRA